MMKRMMIVALTCLVAVGAQAARVNLALSASKVSASYTSSWNNLYSINNGTTGFGTDLANNETWGCYISTSGNQAQQWLQYEWTRTVSVDEVAVYLWSDCQSGSGVAVPDHWELLWLNESGEWKPVTLKADEDYTVERFDVNTVKFNAVETKSLRLVLYAQTNDAYYSAMGVNEWEVYGEYTEEEIIDEDAKVNVAPMAESIDATYTSSWNNLFAINNGTKGTGNELPNNETWGCWQSPNQPQQTLTYYWADEQTLDSVSVYFWSDATSGIGVVVPQSWYLEYRNADGVMQQVELLTGETYGTERLEPNHVKFTPVKTKTMNLVMNAFVNSDGQYAAIGVTEWEVYSASMSVAELLYHDYELLLEEVGDYMSELEMDGYDGLVEYLMQGLIDYEIEPSEEDVTDIRGAMTALQDMLEAAKMAKATCAEIESTLLQAEKLLDEARYPGIEDLNEACEAVYTFEEQGYGTPDEIAAMLTMLTDAITAYRFSQFYSEDEPADYSFMGRSMMFIKEEVAPSIDLETGEVIYPNIDQYAEGTRPADAQSTGWYLGETDGKQEVGFYQNRMCWYAEKTGASLLTINQNLKDLPNGYYAVSAEMITKEGCLSDQHVFAKTQATSVVSPSLTQAGWDVWNGFETSTWERLQTEKILVYDGTLTIGAAGLGDNSSTAGMFAATNFILYYYGEADESNMATLFAEKVQECQTECDGMTYAADRAQYQAVIDANKNASTYDEMKAAMKALNAAQLVAQKSINTYNKFLIGPYKTLQESAFSGNTQTIAQAFVGLVDAENASSTATYKNATAINALINIFLDEYVSVLMQAEDITTSDAETMNVKASVIQSQVDFFTHATQLLSDHQLYVLIDELEKIVSIADVANTLANGGADFTSLIVNPKVKDSQGRGWTIANRGGDGNGVKSGQHYDGKSGYYFDTYNSKSGEIHSTIQQTIDNVPNGVYEFKAMVRVNATPDAEGYYLFAFSDENEQNAIFAPVHMWLHNYTKYDETAVADDGSDLIGYVSNIYGQLWEEAYDWYMGSEDDSLTDFYMPIYQSNSGCGYGWMYVSLQVEVRNHVLTLGVTSDADFTAGHKDTEGNDCLPFSGTWFSADNFSLTMLSQGNNQGWSPATGIEEVNSEKGKVKNEIYDLSGRRIQQMQKGINIVRLSDGTSKKIFVK